MGGCATKPKVTKDGAVDGKAPEPEPEQEALLQEHGGEEIFDDEQSIKPRSLSLLFKENEDAKVSTENEKTKPEETVKQETLETEKPLEDAKTNDPTTKNESPKTDEKLSHETKNNEPATKQEFEPIVDDEKDSLQKQITDPAEETVKTETPEETKKTSEETKINDPVEETEKKLGNAQINELNEPIKEENLFETNQIDDVVVEVPLPEEKVIEVVLTKDTDYVENKVVEAKSSIEEKNHVDVGVEHTSEASDAGADKVSLS